MKFLFILTLTAFLFSAKDCTKLSKYPCTITPECEWITDESNGLCNDLSEDECKSGEYRYCYWNSAYDNQSECLGGKYFRNSGSCEESKNFISRYIDNTVDQALIQILLANGFELKEERNRKVFTSKDVSFAYKSIEIQSNGFKITNPEIFGENKTQKTHISSDYISVNLPFNELIKMLENALYTDQISSMNIFEIDLRNIRVMQDNMDRKFPFASIEWSIDKFYFKFDGYINQSIIDDINKKNQFPNSNQSVELLIKGVNFDTLVGHNGENLKDMPLKLSSFKSNFKLNENNMRIKSDLLTSFFTARLNANIDTENKDNPWINNASLSISNINPIMDDYIRLFEQQNGIKIQRLYNSINISASGSFNNPVINGIEPLTR